MEMEKTAPELRHQPPGIASTETCLVQAWHQEYVAADSDMLGPDSDLIKAVKSDVLDYEHIEEKVRQKMSNTDATRGFCVECRYLLEHWPALGTKSWDWAIGRPLNSHDIEAAARVGCKFCAFLLSRLEVTGLLDTFRKVEARLRMLNDDETASLSIQDWGSQFNQIDSQLLWVNFPGKVATSCNSDGAIILFESHVLSPTANLWQGHIDQFDIARMWLRECSKGHDSCRNIKNPEQPTRLVSIGSDAVRLVLTESLEGFVQYATLSYCWGHKPFPMLTLDRLNSFLVKIPLYELPKTFRDAMQVARELGLAYIWIDALCIIQDGEGNSDWLVEAARMRSVYGGSYVNIAASSAPSVHDGFFPTQTRYNGGFCARITTSLCSRVQNFHAREVYEESSYETRLAARAWALQERLLSRRTIYFGETGMFWECRSAIKSEFLPDGFPDKLRPHMVCPEDQAWDWGEIVRRYSPARLTYESDRLPALSGIASRQHEVTGDQYLAGLWRKSLVTQMPWIRFTREKSKRPKSSVPTWSWMSVDGRTEFGPYWSADELVKKEYVNVLDAWTTPSGPDHFGAVTGGILSLGCHSLVKGLFHELSEPVMPSETTPGVPSTDGILFESEAQPFPIMLDCLEDEYFRIEDPIYLLAVFGGHSGWSSGDEYTPQLVIRGLVIQHCGNKKGRFRRVGGFLYATDLESERETEYHRFMRVLKEEGSTTAATRSGQILSSSDHPEARYVLTIE